ncbi:MAG TPA: ATP-dependent zinc metalloprotease FtsH [Chloroflexota bacterium]|nr:ATP-dependent zinc metalloprotease FtsH [Chloroflexota bacterium]
MKNRLHRLLHRPLFQLGGLAILVVVLGSLVVLANLQRLQAHSAAQPIAASEAATIVKSGQARAIEVQLDRAFLKTDGAEYVFIKDRETSVSQMLAGLGVGPGDLATLTYAVSETSPIPWGEMIPILAITLLLGGVLLVAVRRSGNGAAFKFGRSRARRFVGEAQQVTFDDVAGAAEAKEELLEIVEFLKAPEKFTAMGARIPKGVLLVGPPGTGKTLISRAVAGEAGAPFFSIAGSEFVEMFVGVGASRVRDLFAEAKRQAPSIIFIDEIDAVGRKRSSGTTGGGAHDEREQTLNQILVEMDGFEGNKQVIVLAATNRPDVLDPALLRPGRFDRQVTLANPDVRERTAILAVHARGKPLENVVRLETLARSTPGFSGADLANLINEAAILAVRRSKQSIGMDELQEAIDRVIGGPQKKARVMSLIEQRRTAYHESGHAVVGRFSANHDPVHKVSIVPRGRLGGYTRFLPEEDRHYMTRTGFEAMIASALGGWVAERLIFGDVSTGASNDIEKATGIARGMVTTYGMSESLGPLALGQPDPSGASEPRAYSERVAETIDAEVRALLSAGIQQAEQILSRHRAILDRLTEQLLEDETIEGDDLEEIFQGIRCADGAAASLQGHRGRPGAPSLLPLPRNTQVASVSRQPAE